MKKLCILLSLAVGLIANCANADLVFSTSNTNPLAGSALTLQLNESALLYTWVSSNAPGDRIIGVAFSVGESNPAVVDALSHMVENPGGRWVSANAGTLNSNGNLIHNSASAGVPGAGIATSGPADFVLHSTFEVNALAFGSTILSFVAHTNPGNGIQIQGTSGNQFANTPRGTASIAVIPEPGSALVFISGLIGTVLVRRRK